MAIYELQGDKITKVTATTFADKHIQESDLQHLFCEEIDIIAPNTMVIATEYSDWADSWRSIDILALDRQANLVVIELKRTKDGGHMELQALRYAAMVSIMTFDKVVEAHSRFLKNQSEQDARQAILNFLEWKEPLEDEFAQDVRIVLVSQGFSTEITTTVLWLSDRGLDIRCVKITPYTLDDRSLVDVQHIIPLPEAGDYFVKAREKEMKKRAGRIPAKALPDLLEDFRRSLSNEGYQTVLRIKDWLEELQIEIETTPRGFQPVLELVDKTVKPFWLNLSGRIEINYKSMSQLSYPNEAICEGLQSGLNQIAGVQIQDEQLTKYPHIRLETLSAPAAMQLFKASFEWLFEELRQDNDHQAEG